MVWELSWRKLALEGQLHCPGKLKLQSHSIFYLLWHNRGFSLQPAQLLVFVLKIAQDLLPSDHPIYSGLVKCEGQGKQEWYEGFMSRYPELSLRISDR